MDQVRILKEVMKKHRFTRYSQLLLGLFISALAFNLFLLPFDIVSGGVNGISIIITNFVRINPASFIMVASIVLLIISYFVLGWEATKNSILGSILFPLFVQLTSYIAGFIHFSTNDILLISIIGGVMYGFGAGLVYKAGFTTGGTDIIIQILKKYAKISFGNAILAIDGSIVLAGAFVFGFTRAMYGIVVLYLVSLLTDKVVMGISNSKAFYIITNKYDLISDFIIEELGHSVTVIDAVGAYSNTKNKVLFTVIPTREYFKLKEGIELIDSGAFFTVVDAYEVMGGE